ncbi:PREDICTED: syntaxin-binding protein 6, partial [Cariama cristata]|uniref:syntaxin-binding protein 6 n=1 Tax=Cariama cristata TaxID=54380 RepID=UPI0005201C8F
LCCFFICSVTNKKPAQASITKVKQFEGSTSFVRRTQWMLEQLRQVNGIDPNRDSPEFDLLFENAFDQWVASTASEKCTFFQVLHHTCQRYLTDKKPEFINCQSKIMGGNSILHSAADSVTSAVQKASQALNERGERLGRAEEKTEELKNSAQQFAETAHKEELEAIMQLENYDIVAITETWWDNSHNWSVAMDDYKLFKRDGQGRKVSGVAPFYVCWKHNTAEGKHCRKFLGCVEENSPTQLMREPTREGAPLDLQFVNRGGLVGDVMVGGHLGHSDHKMVRVFDSRRSTQPPELEDRDREQNEGPIIQGEMVSDQLHHLDVHKPMEPDGFPPRVQRELVKVAR